MTACAYDVALIVDRAVCAPRGAVVVEAGVDILAGPYADACQAQRALGPTCRAHPRLAAFAALAAGVTMATDTPPIRIAVLPVTAAMHAQYVQRHGVALPWPLVPLTPAETARVTPRRRPRPATSKETAHGTP